MAVEIDPQEALRLLTHDTLKLIEDIIIQHTDERQSAKLWKSVGSILKDIEKEAREHERYSGELQKLNEKCKLTPQLLRDVKKWLTQRQEFISLTSATADSLDTTATRATIGRMIGAVAEMGNVAVRMASNALGKDLISFIKNPFIKSMFHVLLEGMSHIIYIGLLASAFEFMEKRYQIQRVMDALKEDDEKYQPIKKYEEDSKDLEQTAKQLFPYGIDRDIMAQIENGASAQEFNLKLFAGAFLSNILKNPTMLQNKDYQTKLYCFCASEAGAEWYKRITKVDNLSVILEGERFFSRLNLNESQVISADVAVSDVHLVTRNFPLLVQGYLSCFSLCVSYFHLRNGMKYSCSKTLRELSKDAKNSMDEIKNSFEALYEQEI